LSAKVEQLLSAAAAFGAPLATLQAEKLVLLADLVAAANERVRLTAITGWEEVLAKQLLDSLAPLALGRRIEPGMRVADLGSGGGFPGLVLAIAAPGASFTLIEATRKKADFLAETAAALGLTNVTVWPLRSEEAAAGEGRGLFDLVAARAVAELRVLIELAHPLLKIGGELLAWKGPGTEAEINAANNALAKLGAGIMSVTPYELPFRMGGRCLVSIAKTGPTPAGFPRRPGMAGKKPL
jgi:16S rRNA (guanine527-N7)-methyltransferase